ncbi:UNVERIFIED_CONTAM: hypothetical protein FKN15_078342 [Acipenser sinensis]
MIKYYFRMFFYILGSLSHLKSLQVLMLHNNQLTKLVGTVSELKGMQFLKTLSKGSQ